MRETVRAALLLAALFFAAGCHAIPAGGDPGRHPDVVALAGEPSLGKLAVAPVTTLALAADEATKGWKLDQSEAIRGPRVQAAVARALAATGRFARVRRADAPGDGWSERDDVVASVAVEEVRAHYDGHNGWWIPNIFNWVFWIVPSFWVATEEYSLTLEASVSLASAETGAPLGDPVRVPVRVEATFNEFDRGWQPLGFIYAALDAEVWSRVATTLWPAAEYELAARVAVAVHAARERAAASGALEAARRKTLVLAIGVGRYAETARYPTLPYAGPDAQAIAAAYALHGEPPEHVLTLLDAGATVAAVRSSVALHLGRAREGDAVIVSFAGYGTRTPNGGAALALHDAAGDGGILSLEELAQLLEGVHGSKLVLVDASFGSRGRAVGGGAPLPDEVARLAERSRSAWILASGSDEPALAPEHLHGGLLTHHAVQALGSARGVLTAQGLFDFVSPRVVAEAALLGESERPRGFALERGVAFLPPVAR